MEEFIEVNSLGKKKLDNGLHVGFHRDAYDLVNACEVAKIGITEARKQEWKENLDLEGDINQESTADYITQEIDKKDEARDKLISFLFAMIRDYRLSPENDEAIAAEKLVLLIKPYSKLQRESLRRETDRDEIGGRQHSFPQPLYAEREEGSPQQPTHGRRGTSQDRRRLRPHHLYDPRRLSLRRHPRGSGCDQDFDSRPEQFGG